MASGVEGGAPIHAQIVQGDVPGAVGREEAHRFGDVFGLGDALQGDALRREFQRQAADELRRGGLGGGIGGHLQARRVGVISVADLVSRGRYPHQGMFRQWSRQDEDAVREAMQATGVRDLADRAVDELSGGQRQRGWVAMALAQQTPLLLLDEPTTFLDIAHQIDLLELLRGLNGGHGRTLVAVLRDLNHACRYADHLIAMREGRIVAEGPPGQVVTAELVEQVFGLACLVIEDPVSHTPLVVPRGGQRR